MSSLAQLLASHSRLLVLDAASTREDLHEHLGETIADVQAILKRDGHVKTGDIFISLASMPIHERNRTNMMKVNVVD